MKRLDKIVSFVDKNKVVADIGSDHGITAIKVYQEKDPKRVIATDISAPSLNKLVEKIRHFGYDIQTKVTDGLKNLPEDIEEIIISGMGGYLISEILDGNKILAKNAEKLILSPNNSQEYLRKWLHQNGYQIIHDQNVEDEEIIYDVIVATFTNQKSTYDDQSYYTYGKENIVHASPLTIKLIEKEIDRNKFILSTLDGKDGKQVNQRIQELENEIERMEQVLCKLKK